MADYIFEPVDTDPEVIFQEFQTFMQSIYPNWKPSAAQLDVLMARFFSLKISLTADMVARVTRSIFKWFGANVVSVQPLLATSASVSVIFTAADSVGHTIPSGSDFGLRDSTGDLHIFSLDNDAIIAPSTTAITASASAIEEGVQANNLTGNAEMINQFDWLSSAVTSGPSSGGVDEEAEDVYLNRLTANLGLMSPRPILAPDFALLARNIPGVWRAIALDNFLPGTSEVQTLTHNRTGGTFQINFTPPLGSTAQTSSLNWNATAAQIQAAMDALVWLEPGDVVVTGGPLPATVTFTFGGNYRWVNLAQITITDFMTGGTTTTPATTVAGVAPNTFAENAVLMACIDIDGNPVSAAKKTEVDDYLQSLLQQNFVLNITDATYATVDVTYNGVKRLGADSADVLSRTNQAIVNFFDPATWGVPDWPPDARGWERRTVIRQQELYTVMNNVQGFDFASTLNFAVYTDPLSGIVQDSSSKTMAGWFPLPKLGTITPNISG